MNFEQFKEAADNIDVTGSYTLHFVKKGSVWGDPFLELGCTRDPEYIRDMHDLPNNPGCKTVTESEVIQFINNAGIPGAKVLHDGNFKRLLGSHCTYVKLRDEDKFIVLGELTVVLIWMNDDWSVLKGMHGIVSTSVH